MSHDVRRTGALLLFAPASARRRPVVATFLGLGKPGAACSPDLWEVRDLADDVDAPPLAAAATWAPDARGVVEIVSFLTAPSQRRRGVATLLLQGIGDAVRTAGGSGLRAHVAPGDAAAVRVLERCDFAAEHVVTRQDERRLLCLEQPL